MDELLQLRNEIEATDRELARLFQRRMELAEQIGRLKRERGLSVYDGGREAALLEKESGFVSEPLRPYYIRLLKELLMLSKERQEEIL